MKIIENIFLGVNEIPSPDLSPAGEELSYPLISGGCQGLKKE